MRDSHKIILGVIVGLIMYHFYMKSQSQMGGGGK